MDLVEAARCLSAWDERAVRYQTPCGQGVMVWRRWGEGAPLLLVHGGAGGWSHWIRNLEPLARRFAVYVPDLPGLGESASPPDPYTPESIAEIVAGGLVEILGENSSGENLSGKKSSASPGPMLSICGFSFGGMICGLVAERVSSLVRRVVLIGASGLGGTFDDLAPVYRLPRDASPAELDAVHRRNLEIMMLHSPRAVDALALRIQTVNAPRTRVMSPEHALTTKLADSLRRSALPVASIWGEHCIFSRDLRRRQRALDAICPGAPFYVVAGAGHWAQYESPEVVNSLLLRLMPAED